MNEALAALRDVSGVHGSFVVAQSGALVARDLPAVFENKLLTDVGQRVVNLHDAFSSSGEDFDSCVMRFSEHKVHLKRLTKGFLCVLTSNVVNSPALKMALTLTARRVESTIITGPPPPVAPVPSTAPPPPTSSEAPKKQPRFYRGHRID